MNHLQQIRKYKRSKVEGIYQKQQDELAEALEKNGAIYTDWDETVPAGYEVRMDESAGPGWLYPTKKVYYPPKDYKDTLNLAALLGIYKEEEEFKGGDLIPFVRKTSDAKWEDVQEKTRDEIASLLRGYIRRFHSTGVAEAMSTGQNDMVYIPKESWKDYMAPAGGDKGTYFVDLLDMGVRAPRWNKGTRYLFTALNAVSRFVYVFPISMKKGIKSGEYGEEVLDGSLGEAIQKMFAATDEDAKLSGLGHRKVTHIVGDGEFGKKWVYNEAKKRGVGVEWTEKHTHEQLSRLNAYHRFALRAWVSDFVNFAPHKKSEVAQEKYVNGKQVRIRLKRNPFKHHSHVIARELVDEWYAEHEDDVKPSHRKNQGNWAKTWFPASARSGEWTFMRDIDIDTETWYPATASSQETERMPLIQYITVLYNMRPHSGLRPLPRVYSEQTGSYGRQRGKRKRAGDPVYTRRVGVKRVKGTARELEAPVMQMKKMAPADIRDTHVEELLWQDEKRRREVEQRVDKFITDNGVQWANLIPKQDQKHMATHVRLHQRRSWLEGPLYKDSQTAEWSDRFYPLIARNGTNTFYVEHDMGTDVPHIWPIYRLAFMTKNAKFLVHSQYESLAKTSAWRDREEALEEQERKQELANQDTYVSADADVGNTPPRRKRKESEPIARSPRPVRVRKEKKHSNDPYRKTYNTGGVDEAKTEASPPPQKKRKTPTKKKKQTPPKKAAAPFTWSFPDDDVKQPTAFSFADVFKTWTPEQQAEARKVLLNM